MNKILWLDTETFSECDLKAGTHRYAEHESTEITVAQWAIDDGEPIVVDCTGRYMPPELVDILNDQNYIIKAHNSAFDRTVIRHVWGLDIPVERWEDTMIKALSHGLPGGLDKIGQIMNVSEDRAKDKRGKELIQLFCKPRPKNQKLRRATRETHPKEWAEFLEYSRQDIIAMREIDSKLPDWNYRQGHSELSLWYLDQHINDRGFTVDMDLAHAAVSAVAREQKRLKQEVYDATDGLVVSASKRDQLLAFICAEYGVDLPDLRADTLRRRIDDPDLPDGVRLLLSLRLEATKTSTAKYNSLLRATSADGQLRNTLQFAGAQRTARWAGRIFQPQNMPRPDMDQPDIDEGIAALKAGCADLFFNDVMRLTANTVRGCIIAPEGHKLVVSDLANIEGRGLAFLAGEHWKLKAFADYDTIIGYNEKGDAIRKGHDLYNVAYARSFNIDVKTVNKKQRQIGKVQELGLGYEGGVAAFLTFAAVYNMDLEELAEAVWNSVSKDDLQNAVGMYEWAKKRRRTLGLSERVYVACEVLKRAWRDAHPATVKLWAEASESTRKAIFSPGVTFPIGPHLKVRRDGAWLRIRLPSGRYLCYVNPEVAEDGQISYYGINQYTRQWSRIKTYGGKIIENCTQAFARDILAYNMPTIENQGYKLILSVHDELLTITPNTPNYNVDTLSQIMATQPPWAKGIPLAAAGFEDVRYRKD